MSCSMLGREVALRGLRARAQPAPATSASMSAAAAASAASTAARPSNASGLNVIAPARRVQVAYLADPPSSGARMLAESGVEIIRV